MINNSKNKRVYLVGFMGAGKTTFGKMLASRLGYTFLDLDIAFEEKYKTTVDLFFKKYGEEVFRKLEYELLLSTFELEDHVISTGGGTPCFFDSMEQINKHGVSVYLKMPPKALYDRLVHAKKLRPLVAKKSDSELLEFIEQKLAEREPYYSKADYIVSGLSVNADFIAGVIKSNKD
jgi:shikimate kinase